MENVLANCLQRKMEYDKYECAALVPSLPYSLSLVSSLFSFGGWVIVLSVVQIAVQVILLRKKCKPLEIFIQTILAFVYGYLTNLSCLLIRNIPVNSYPEQLLYMAIGCFVLALGIWLQLKGGVAMLSGEAMNRAVSEVMGKRYENIKILFDIIYLALSAVICLVFLGELKGVREGSIISAIAVGLIIKLYNMIFDKIKIIKRRKYGTEDTAL